MSAARTQRRKYERDVWRGRRGHAREARQPACATRSVRRAAGLRPWSRGGRTEHVEKAFDFAGMGARNGVTAATMVQAGFSGVPDVLDGEHNMLIALSAAPHPEEMVAGLGSRFFVTETAIKPYSVGYPIQSAVDAFLALRREHGLTVANVRHITVRLPEDGARIVDNSAMPDVNCQSSSRWRWWTARCLSTTATPTRGWSIRRFKRSGSASNSSPIVR